MLKLKLKLNTVTRRPLLTSLAAVSLGIVSPLGMGAAWSAETPAASGQEVVVVTPAGLPKDQLQQEIADAFANAAQAGPENEISAQAAAASTSIRYRWKDHGGREVVYRDDAIEKMRTKHGITRSPTQRSTQFPDKNVSTKEGTARVYYATFEKRRCTTIFTCTVDAKTRMKTVVDFRLYGGTSETKGVVTSFCEGTTVCPSWVNAVS